MASAVIDLTLDSEPEDATRNTAHLHYYSSAARAVGLFDETSDDEDESFCAHQEEQHDIADDIAHNNNCEESVDDEEDSFIANTSDDEESPVETSYSEAESDWSPPESDEDDDARNMCAEAAETAVAEFMKANLGAIWQKIAAESTAEVGEVVYSNLKRKFGKEEVCDL
jgi:hypothetical protein